MEPKPSVERHAEAAKEFNRHESRDDGATVAGSLSGGLRVLGDSFYQRVQRDVEKTFGRDSMLMPLSEAKSETLTKTQIEIYEIAESAAAAREHGYVKGRDDWYVRWLTRLRLGDIEADVSAVRRRDDYLAQTPDERRLAFTDVLERVLPESRRAPLVLFRLVPLAVRIVTSLAFGDHPRAWNARDSQKAYLAAIGYCGRCQGKVLENGEQCPGCGNPMWKYDWLTATD
ncbi:MAG: hypothetical protein ACYTG0_28780 [Planctomycetota bacterium]|jgi:hypothetical protein